MIKRSNKQQQPPLLKSEHNDDNEVLARLLLRWSGPCSGTFKGPYFRYASINAFVILIVASTPSIVKPFQLA